MGHDADGSGGVLAAWVAVGAAAFAGSGCAAPGPVGQQVAGLDQVGCEVCQGAPQSGWGERAARVAESRAASRARLKLTRPGSRPVGAA